MRKEVLYVWFDKYPNDDPLQNVPTPSVEFLNIKVRFFKSGVRRPPMEIELHSSIVPVQQLTNFQQVRDFFSPIVRPIGAEEEDLNKLSGRFLRYTMTHKEKILNSNELPITVQIDAVVVSDEEDDQVRVAATEIGLPSAIMEKGLGEQQQQCAICLGELLHGCRATHLTCAHVYHTNCILEWLQRKQSKPNCPLCRRKVPVVFAAKESTGL